MPARKKKGKSKIVKMPNMAKRRRRLLNAAVAADAGSEIEEAASEQQQPSLAEKVARTIANAAPVAAALSDVELISELVRRFGSNERDGLRELLEIAADNSIAQRAAVQAANESCSRLAGILEHKADQKELAEIRASGDAAAMADYEFHRRMHAELKAGVLAGDRERPNAHAPEQLAHIGDRYLVKEITRFASPENDLSPIFEIVRAGIDKPRSVKRPKTIASR
jgi:hypothetical protein